MTFADLNIDVTQEAPATVQYGPLGQERNDDLVPRSQATEFLRKVFKRIVFKRYRNNRVGEGSETVTVIVKKIIKRAYLLCREHKQYEAQC